MKKLDRLMPFADNAAKEILAQGGKIPKEYNGYISSFGAMARAGLKPAIAVFENKNADSRQDRTKLTKAVLDVVCGYRGINERPSTLMEYVLSCQDLSSVKKDIMDAATSLKLIIRTFELVESGRN